MTSETCGEGTVATETFEEPGERRLEVSKRIWRVLRIANLITSQPRQWKRSGLATLCEVNNRSIDRDLELLRGLGYELLRMEQGYAFARTPALPSMVLSLPEVLALTLAAGLARDSGDIDTASLGAALARLEALVPHSARPLVRRELWRESSVASLEQRRVSLANPATRLAGAALREQVRAMAEETAKAHTAAS